MMAAKVKSQLVISHRLVLVICAAIILACSPGAARATTVWFLVCNGTTNLQLSGALAGTVPWTASYTKQGVLISDSPGTQVPASGDIVSLDGFCLEDPNESTSAGNVNISGITIAGHTYNPSAPAISSTDGIVGEIFDNVGDVTFAGITFSGLPSDHASVDANLQVAPGASALMYYCKVTGARRAGIDAYGSLEIFASTITGNGLAGIAPWHQGGIIAAGAGVQVVLGTSTSPGIDITPDSDFGDSISGNAGYGVAALDGAAVVVFGGSISGNGTTEIDAVENSKITLSGASVTGSSGAGLPAVSLFNNSTLISESSATIQGGNGEGAVGLIGDSSATLVDSSLSGTGAAPVLEASTDASILMQSGNSIDATGTGGTAVEIDHSSSFNLPAASSLLGSIPAANTITGAGVVQVQSSMDLGPGLISSSPGITWNGTIAVQQNSSFRLSGGVDITGKVSLAQGSNGFFNTANGGNNAVSSVVCPFTTSPDSHVANPTFVTPALTTSTSPTTTNKECLPF